MHGGVLRGYPAVDGASHAMNVAVKMWGWTRMGARVVVTPVKWRRKVFASVLARKDCSTHEPAAAAEDANNVAVTAKSAKGSHPSAATTGIFRASLELKSTVGHDLGVSVQAKDVVSNGIARPNPHRRCRQRGLNRGRRSRQRRAGREQSGEKPAADIAAAISRAQQLNRSGEVDCEQLEAVTATGPGRLAKPPRPLRGCRKSSRGPLADERDERNACKTT